MMDYLRIGSSLVKAVSLVALLLTNSQLELANTAEACGIPALKRPIAEALRSDLQNAKYKQEKSNIASLTFTFSNDTENVFVIERSWGKLPASFSSVWGTAIAPSGRSATYYSSDHGEPFSVAFTSREVKSDGSLGPRSAPVFLRHNPYGSEENHSDFLLFGLLTVGLFFTWRLYRAERKPQQRARIAALSGLASLMFLAATPTMPWLETTGAESTQSELGCHLGDEIACATWQPNVTPDPLAQHAPVAQKSELIQWMMVSSALQFALIFLLLSSLPLYLWIALMPSLRSAQFALCSASSLAVYTLLATTFYMLTLPSWVAAQWLWTPAVAVLASGNLLVSACLIFRSALGRPTLTTTSTTMTARVVRYEP